MKSNNFKYNQKCENAWHVQNNVAIANNCWICQQFDRKHLLNITNVALSDSFSLTLSKSFYEIYSGRKFLFHIFVVVVYYSFYKSNFIEM